MKILFVNDFSPEHTEASGAELVIRPCVEIAKLWDMILALRLAMARVISSSLGELSGRG
jgi:hypothetical protein